MADMCGKYSGGPALDPMVVTVNSDEMTIRSLLGNLQEEAIRGNKMMIQMQSFLFGPDISETLNSKESPKNLCEDIRRLLELLIDTNNRAESVLHILGA